MAFRGRMRSGELPEFGAIFMSNRRTKRECLQRELFGLPLKFIDFVKSIRAGMILFLFEHERRELYGVFEAISDGGMDIVPHAYLSSRRAYPAQVKVRALWNCYPLSESCFRDAIRENYYAAYKFNFGLSKEQVHRLLSLFSVRRAGHQVIPKQKKIQGRHSRSPDKESISIDSEDHVVPDKFHVIPQKSESPDAKMSNYRSGSISSPIGEQKEIKRMNLPSSDFLELGDYIPLSLPQEESKRVDLPASDSLELGDYIPLSLSQEEIKRVDLPASDSLELGDNIPLSLPEHTEPQGNHDQKPLVKGLYSDIQESKRSVFSRLTMHSLAMAQEEEQDNSINLEITESVEKVMQNLQLRHENWVKKRKRVDTSTSQNVENSVCQRNSVFSRLSFTSAATNQNTKTDKTHDRTENVSKPKKRKVTASKEKKKEEHDVFSKDHCNACNNNAVQMDTLDNRQAVAEAPVALGITENKNGSVEENMSLQAARSVLFDLLRGVIDKYATDVATKLKDKADAPPEIDHKVAESKPSITYEHQEKHGSASASVKEPAENITSDKRETQQ